MAEIPGIGPIGGLTLAVRIDPRQFQSGRHLAAWIGLTPREHSSGGKRRIGGISRTGDERLRPLPVLGVTAIIRCAKPGRASAWLLSGLERRPRKLAAVALANKACSAQAGDGPHRVGHDDSVDPTIQNTPARITGVPTPRTCLGLDCGTHLGQRQVPRKQAGHMTAHRTIVDSSPITPCTPGLSTHDPRITRG